MNLTVIDYIEHKDGGATVHFDMDEDYINAFVRQGLRTMIEEVSSDYCVLKPEEWDEWAEANDVPAPRSIELTSEEVQAYFQVGVLKAIKVGMEECSGL